MWNLFKVVFLCWLWTSKCRLGWHCSWCYFVLFPLKESYWYFFRNKQSLVQNYSIMKDFKELNSSIRNKKQVYHWLRFFVTIFFGTNRVNNVFIFLFQLRVHETRISEPIREYNLYCDSVKVFFLLFLLFICMILLKHHPFNTYAKSSKKTDILYPLMRTRTCSYQGDKKA